MPIRAFRRLEEAAAAKEGTARPAIWPILRPLLLPFFFPGILRAVGQLTLAPFVALYAIELGATDGGAGLCVGANSLTSMLCSPTAGVVVSRAGERRAMLLGVVVNIAAALTGALAGSYYQVLLCSRLLQGVGNVLFQLARQSYITARVPSAARGRLGALQSIVLKSGGVLGPWPFDRRHALPRGGTALPLLAQRRRACRHLCAHRARFPTRRWWKILARNWQFLGNNLLISSRPRSRSRARAWRLVIYRHMPRRGTPLVPRHYEPSLPRLRARSRSYSSSRAWPGGPTKSPSLLMKRTPPQPTAVLTAGGGKTTVNAQ